MRLLVCWRSGEEPEIKRVSSGGAAFFRRWTDHELYLYRSVQRRNALHGLDE